MTNTQAGTGGGSATAGGINFQCRVGAWVCCYLLAEASATPVGPPGAPRYIRFETAEPTDDILVGTTEQRHSFVQAKRTIGFGAAELSSVSSNLCGSWSGLEIHTAPGLGIKLLIQRAIGWFS